MSEPSDGTEIQIPAIRGIQECSREELFALISDLLNHDPGLREWVTLWIETKGRARAAEPGMQAAVTVDVAEIRRQATTAFGDKKWDRGRRPQDIAEDLRQIGEKAAWYAEAEQWANAVVVYTTLADVTLARMGEIDDHNFYLDHIISACADGLEPCLVVQTSLADSDRLPSHLQLDAIQTMYRAWDRLRIRGDLGRELPGVVAELATPDERVTLESTLRAAVADDMASGIPSTHYREQLIGFLLALKAQPGLSDEEVLAEYYAAQLYEYALAQLMTMGRVEEAIRVASQYLSSAWEITNFANQLLALGGEWVEQALCFIEDQVVDAKQPASSIAYLRWLEEHYREQKMPEQALDAAQRHFQMAPSAETYRAVRHDAHLPGQPGDLWNSLRPGLIATLEEKARWSELVRVYVEEKSAQAALDALDSLEKTATHYSQWGRSSHRADRSLESERLAVAGIAEQDFPDQARILYQQVAEVIADSQDRASYGQAADYLMRAKALYIRVEQEAEWQSYIADLRSRTKRLRAFKAELDMRGLE